MSYLKRGLTSPQKSGHRRSSILSGTQYWNTLKYLFKPLALSPVVAKHFSQLRSRFLLAYFNSILVWAILPPKIEYSLNKSLVLLELLFLGGPYESMVFRQKWSLHGFVFFAFSWHSQSIPMTFPKHSHDIPKAFPWHSQNMPIYFHIYIYIYMILPRFLHVC